MKITEYPELTKLGSDAVMLTDGASGTKKFKTSNLILEMLAQISPEMHRLIFRGKNLGGSFTAEQKAAVKAGTFDGLFLGDYWVISNVTYRIADFDYYLRCGNTDFTSHHLVIVPDVPMYQHVMNDEAKTEGGYVLSKMYTEGLEEAKTKINAAFPSSVLTHKEYLVNATRDGRPSGGGWFESTVELMNENMVYGGKIFSPVSDGTNVSTNYTVCKSQLALFQAKPSLIHNRQTYWLRDVVSGAAFALVTAYGSAYCGSASYSRGVRPVFIIG